MTSNADISAWYYKRAVTGVGMVAGVVAGIWLLGVAIQSISDGYDRPGDLIFFAVFMFVMAVVCFNGYRSLTKKRPGNS